MLSSSSNIIRESPTRTPTDGGPYSFVHVDWVEIGISCTVPQRLMYFQQEQEPRPVSLTGNRERVLARTLAARKARRPRGNQSFVIDRVSRVKT